MLLKIAFVIFIRLNFVYNCEESQSEVTDTSYVSGEYQNIFKGIPALFEYVLDIIEQKPGILEKDDVTVFTEDNNDVHKREIVAADVNEENLDDEVNNGKQLGFDPVWDWYPGATGRKGFDLSPDEVADKTLEVERHLETYNMRRA